MRWNYYEFVSALEGALEAGKLLNKRLIDRWYDLWMLLESVGVQKGNEVKAEKIEKYLADIKSYLESVLNQHGRSERLRFRRTGVM